jgi:hypothetical protein
MVSNRLGRLSEYSRSPPHVQSLESRIDGKSTLVVVKVVLDLVPQISELGLGVGDV